MRPDTVEGRFPVKVTYSAVFTQNIVMKRVVKLRLLRCKVRLIYIKACGEIGVLNNPEHPVRSIHLSNVHAQVRAQESMLCSTCDLSSNTIYVTTMGDELIGSDHLSTVLRDIHILAIHGDSHPADVNSMHVVHQTPSQSSRGLRPIHSNWCRDLNPTDNWHKMLLPLIYSENFISQI